MKGTVHVGPRLEWSADWFVVPTERPVGGANEHEAMLLVRPRWNPDYSASVRVTCRIRVNVARRAAENLLKRLVKEELDA